MTRSHATGLRPGLPFVLLSLVTFLTAPLDAQAGNAATFTVGSATASRGTTATGTIDVPAGPDSALHIPVAVIHGARPGPVVAFVAGSHGTEYTSIVAMQRLIPRIDAKKLTGTVIVVPIINIPSIETMTPHLNPIDRKGMNSTYPGDANGTQTQRALAAMTREVVTPADYVVDLHGGDLDEDLRPYSYWYRGGRPAQDSVSHMLALAFGLDHIIVVDVDASNNPGRSLSTQALVRGKNILIAEAGRSGTVLPGDLKSLVDGSLNVLGALKMIDRPVHPLTTAVWIQGTGVPRVTASGGGMFFATVPRDARVKKGQVIGYTTDYLGMNRKDIVAPVDGLVTFIRAVPSMWSGATLANVAPTMKTPPAWKAP
jgi:predicted deacylase